MDFMKLFGRTKSKDVAKDRLKLVLMGDRGVSPEFLDMIKGEIMQVLQKYMDIQNDELDIQLTKTESEDGERLVPALVANIPIKNMKKRS